jgi:hypothetical protein
MVSSPGMSEKCHELTSCSGWKTLEAPQWSGSTEGLSRLRHEHVVLEWRLDQLHG